MFVYNMGTVDHFHGMTQLKDFIELCPAGVSGEAYSNYPSVRELKLFLTKCFMEIKCRDTYWEGDIRSDEIYISAIPKYGDDNDLPDKLIVFKQDNNGSTFMVSECILKQYDDPGEYCDQVPQMREFEQDDLLVWMEQSMDLVDRLFEDRNVFKITKAAITISDQRSPPSSDTPIGFDKL